MKLYTPGQLMKGAGISRDLYNQWLFKGVIRATQEAEGPGTTSMYSMEDIIRVAVVRSLRNSGIRLKPAIRFAEQIENILGNQLKKGAIAALGEVVLLNGLDAGEKMIYGKEAPDWPVSICINIGKIRDEIVKSLEAE